jgi:hypothetical protein
MAHDHTTDTRIAAPRTSTPLATTHRSRLHHTRLHSTRLPNWDVTRLASLSDGGRFRSTQRCDSVAINNKTKTNNKPICSALMGCSDARRVTSQSSSRIAKPPHAPPPHTATNHCHPESPPTNSPQPHASPPQFILSPEYASAVTLPRISSESVKKMALAQRKKAF